MESVVRVSDAVKHFGSLKAIDSVTFEVKKNSLFGLAGPDGAGKSTLIRMLCGLVNADSGEIEILGAKLPSEYRRVRNNIGYLSQKFSLYGNLTVDENIEFIADIHGVADFRERREELLGFTRMTNFRKFLAGNLSGGMKQKLGLACSLIHRPRLLLLDEPTTGVDPVSRREFWLILARLMKEDITIIVSTPYMEEAERFSEIALIEKGKLLAVDSPGGIKSLIDSKVLEIVCSPARRAYDLLTERGTAEVQLTGDRVNVLLESDSESEDTIAEFLKVNGVDIADLRITRPTLENAFIHLMREKG